MAKIRKLTTKELGLAREAFKNLKVLKVVESDKFVQIFITQKKSESKPVQIHIEYE